MERFRLTAWLLVSTVAAASGLRAASVAGSDNVELHVKAAYLLHFARYVYWPSSSTTLSSPLVLGVFGAGPMPAILEQTVSGKTVNNRPIRVQQFYAVDQIERCDILFVPKSESRHAQEVLGAVSGRPIVTVSDQESFASAGGMIEFLLIDDTVRFAVNNSAIERAGLKLGSELLRAAYSINGRRK